MIDPTDVTNYSRTDHELQEWWLFSTIVAGKQAATQARLLDGLLSDIITGDQTPFEALFALTWAELEYYLRQYRIGQYSRIMRCWGESIWLDLRYAPLQELEGVYGVGPKTARMFLMHSRPNQRLAALDTHVLKHLSKHGYKVPRNTPSSRSTYLRLEKVFLDLADAAGKSPADYDLEVWKSYALI